jgi:hypothetical protein
MLQSILLVAGTALATWLVIRWLRSDRPRSRTLSHEEQEIGRAKDIGVQLDGARERASVIETERNRLALAKAVKAALWVTESRLNFAVPELLKLAQLWIGQSTRAGKKWKAPAGVTQVEGFDDPRCPWAAWVYKTHHWRVEGRWGPSTIPDEVEGEVGTCRVLLDNAVVLDMTISSNDRRVMWIDALTVGPWVSELLTFAGAQKGTLRPFPAPNRRIKIKSARTTSTGRKVWLIRDGLARAFHPKRTLRLHTIRRGDAPCLPTRVTEARGVARRR